MTSTGFIPVIPAIKRLQTNTLDSEYLCLVLFGSVLLSKQKEIMFHYRYICEHNRVTRLRQGCNEKPGDRKSELGYQRGVTSRIAKVKLINMTDDYRPYEESFPWALRSTFHYFTYHLPNHYYFSYEFYLSQRHSFRTTLRTFYMYKITRRHVLHAYRFYWNRGFESTLILQSYLVKTRRLCCLLLRTT